MKARFLLAAAAFACAVFTAEAFDTYKDALQAARKARNDKKFDESLKNLEEAKSLAQKTGEKVQALDIASDIYMWNKKDLKKAVAQLDELLGLEGISANQKVNTLVKKANFLKWNGKKGESEEFYKKAMELEVTGGTKQNLMNSYADLLRINKKYDDAMKLYQECAALEKGTPNNIQNAKLGIARVTADMKEYDKAFELYIEITKIPNVAKWIAEPAYREIIDKVYFPQKKYEEAAAFLDKMSADENLSSGMKAWITDARIRINHSQANDLIREKKFDEAAEKLKAADVSKTKTAWIKEQRVALEATLEITRGNEFRKEKKYDEALEAFKKVLDLKNLPFYSKHSAYLNIVNVLLTQKKLDEAKEYIDKAMAISNLNPNMKANNQHTLASYYLAKQEVDEALAALEKVSSISGKLDPSWKAYAYTRLADIYFSRKKDLAKADEYIKKAADVPNAKWGKNKNLEKRIQTALEKQNQ